MTQGPDPRYQYTPHAAATFTVAAPARGSELLAGRGPRLVARVLDTLIVGLGGVPALVVWMVYSRHLAEAMAILPLLLAALQAYLIAATGQSLAKNWLGIKIVRLDGSPAGFVAGVLLREVVFFVVELIPFVGLFLRVADAVLIFGEERRCLHDLLCGTMVIAARPAG